ncbi:isoleucine--tRNA ligase [Ferroplasma sp.]|uniref:isoleucine--tRNA ligase n=1 Tax=Ferroplasma sp. TaxID=2591003 RepID=UPI00260F98A3|nr:isoleucine--tRNA ligase [Ferroplasma sp.]
MTANFYQTIDVNKSLMDIEKEIRKYWEDNKIIENILHKSRNLKQYTFLEGPPTANGRPHVGHLMTRTVKDTVMRYKYMSGYDIGRRTGGWDCHGLPVELEAEKHFGFNTKKEIEDFGIEKFNEYCRNSVFTYIDEWNAIDSEIGYWIDEKDSYVTLRNDYMESEWYALKKLFEDKMLVKDYKIVPYCPRCGTSLSSHEVAQGYKNTDDTSVYVKFRVKNSMNRYLIAWTTTPWTLPSNELLVVNKDLEYTLVSDDGNEYYVLSDMVQSLFKNPKVLKTMKGSDLVGIRYDQLMSFLHVGKNALQVVAGDFVTAEDGTGIVHAAPAFGADDFDIAKQYNIDLVNPVDSEGKFDNSVPWKNKFVMDANSEIIGYLKENKLLFKSQKIKHTYPFCYRCGTKLLYYPLDAWFIRVSTIRDLLKKNNDRVNWYPEYLKYGRFGNFLDDAKDWALSRNRYWGTPLPIWRCANEHYLAIGSREDLEKYGGNIPDDLHRPFIDNVKLKCPVCSEPMSREPYVIDTWFDSGSASYAAMHYPFNKNFNTENIPVDFITEAIDQTRGWFYTLHVIASLLFGRNAYKNVMSMSFILDEKGQKMSKSKGNFVTASQFISMYGADPARLFFYTGAPWNSKSIDKKLINDTSRKVFGTLSNVYSFFASNANLDGFVFKELEAPKNLLDKWILSRLNTTIENVTKNMDEFDMHIALRNLMDLINDFSNYYLRLSRKRFWEGELDEEKRKAYETLYYTLINILKMLAPLAPFYSDYMYQKLSGPEKTIHSEKYPSPDSSYIYTDLEKEFKYAISMMELSRRARQESNIKGRQVVNDILIYSDVKLNQSILDIISPELNAREIKFIPFDGRPVKVTLKPIFSKVAPILRGDTNRFAEYLSGGEIYSELKNTGKIIYGGNEFTEEFLEIHEEPYPEYAFASDEKTGISVFINKNIDTDLLLAGYAREIIRRIQIMRKDLNLEYSANIKTTINAVGDIRKSIDKFKDLIQKETLSKSIEFSSSSDGKTWEIDGENVQIRIIPVN